MSLGTLMGSAFHCLARLPSGSMSSPPSHSLFLTDTEATSGEGASQGSEYFSLLEGFGRLRGPGMEGGDAFLPPLPGHGDTRRCGTGLGARESL